MLASRLFSAEFLRSSRRNAVR
uniref:Uncharacterized protein n=1 Tax=Anguilla anguilla TaxID=7936 RepID=A0A0E9X921_ANGAN